MSLHFRLAGHSHVTRPALAVRVWLLLGTSLPGRDLGGTGKEWEQGRTRSTVCTWLPRQGRRQKASL